MVKTVLEQELDRRVDEKVNERMNELKKSVLEQELERRVNEKVSEKERQMLRVALEARFGPLPPGVQQRLDGLPQERSRRCCSRSLRGKHSQKWG